MGRAGVTLQEVEKAVLQLQGRGRNPSVDAIREILGTGSKSTIAQHLRDWRAKQSYASGKLPQDLLALVTGLWERLNLQAEQRIAENEVINNQQLQELQQVLTKLHQDHTHLQKQSHQSDEAYIAERLAKEQLEKDLRKEQQEHAKVLERHLAHTQQITDYKAENARLHQLANNIQANLEHYQNAIQQLRTEQNLIIEKQQAQFQQEASQMQREINSHRNQSMQYEQQISKNNMELKQLQLLHQEHEVLKNNIQLNANQLIIFKERYESNNQQLRDTLNDLTDKNKQLIECEKQIAIFKNHCDRLQNQLSKSEDKIELLRQEKLFLAQEKSELQGHLNKLEGEKVVQ